MNVLTSPDFTVKLATLNQETIQDLYSFISNIEKSENIDITLSNTYSSSLLDDNIYSAKIGPSRIYYTIDSNGEESFLLLLDIAEMQKTPTTKASSFFTANNPRTNSAFNPKLNSSINPKLNSSINPKLNSSINPKLNSSINPKLNSSINPKLNSSINPKLNSSINPKLNSSINPKLNSSLNPRINKSYGGPYLYGSNLEQEAYSVKANSKVELLFNASGDFYGFIVATATSKVKNEFDKNNNWTGYYVKANDKVWLKFSTTNEWLGLLV